MDKPLAGKTDQCNATIGGMTLMVRRNDTKLIYGSQDQIYAMDHGASLADVPNTSNFFLSQPCYSLSDLIRRGWGFVNWWVSHYL